MTRLLAVEVGVPLEQIKFVGCQSANFSVLLLPDPGNNRHYLIRYPISLNYSYEAYVGPIAHEFSHIAQIAASGGLNELRAELDRSPDRIELGADFIAGIVFRRHTSRLDRAQFQNSMDLLGNYKVSGLLSHGTPEARMAAFRSGFYLDPAPSNIIDAHQMFQDDRYGEIVRDHRGG